MQLAVKTKIDNKAYDITDLVSDVEYMDKLNDGCSRLTFSYLNDDIVLENGDVLWYKYNDTEIFYGYVFKVSRDKGKEIKITAYDQLRYAKAKDYLYRKDYTLTSLVNKMCTFFNFKKGSIASSSYNLSARAHDGDTWLDIIYTAISDVQMNKGKTYCLRDEFGYITLRDMDDMFLKLVLGDESLCYDYSHDMSIDDDFYNQILLLIKGDKGIATTFVGAKDKSSIQKYGMLQYYEKLSDSDMTKAKAQAMADTMLKSFNNVREALTLECLGDTRVRAGVWLWIDISDLGITKKLYVKSVTHKYLPTHTMTVEVAI